MRSQGLSWHWHTGVDWQLSVLLVHFACTSSTNFCQGVLWQLTDHPGWWCPEEENKSFYSTTILNKSVAVSFNTKQNHTSAVEITDETQCALMTCEYYVLPTAGPWRVSGGGHHVGSCCSGWDGASPAPNQGRPHSLLCSGSSTKSNILVLPLSRLQLFTLQISLSVAFSLGLLKGFFSPKFALPFIGFTSGMSWMLCESQNHFWLYRPIAIYLLLQFSSSCYFPLLVSRHSHLPLPVLQYWVTNLQQTL